MPIVDDDKVVTRQTTDKIRIAELNINIINEKINVVVYLGNIVNGDFVAIEKRNIQFVGNDFTALYDAMTIKLLPIKVAIKNSL